MFNLIKRWYAQGVYTRLNVIRAYEVGWITKAQAEDILDEILS